MDTITVIFTGLMIFDVAGRTVYLPKVKDHVLTVTPNPSGEPVQSVKFTGLAKGESRFHSFPILNLADHAGVMLKVSAGIKASIAVNFKGEFMGEGDHDECRLDGNERPTWMSVKWVVEIDRSPTLVLTGAKGGQSIPLKVGERVTITNDNPTAVGSHLPMYTVAVTDLDGGPVTIGECVNAKGRTIHNPLTCPPVMLK